MSFWPIAVELGSGKKFKKYCMKKQGDSPLD
jgi:hypothetical protein